MLKFIILASLVALAQGQSVGFGACPTVTVMKTVDMAQLSGMWYEYQRYYTYFDTGKCVSHNLINLFNYAHIVMTSATNPSTNAVANPIGVNVYTANLGIAALPGQFALAYPLIQPVTPMPYSILNTDYTSYAIVWMCTDLGFMHTKFSWLLTRARVPATTVLAKAYADYDLYKIDRNSLNTVDQTNC